MNLNYFSAKASAQQVGKDVADFLKWLNEKFGLRYSDVHLIGHSLGGQAAGSAGKHVGGRRIGRISGDMMFIL